MKFLYVKLIGYAGFYHGMGLKEIEIDFSRSKFPITVITGPNACGKSTLLNALNLLPDSNDNFEPGMSASKYMRIFDNGIIYEIFMNHPIDSKGNRAVTKVSIMKNGVELNPNGNVSSYKDIIFNEFDLDSNYITLSYLSGTDRGLADKRPGERKKFITNIVSSLEVYNDINKNLNKRSNVYKSQLNALGTKINNIGDANALASTQVSLITRQKKLETNLEVLKTRVIENTTKVSMQDPEGEIHRRYDELDSTVKNLKIDIDKTNIKITQPLIELLEVKNISEITEEAINNKLAIYNTQLEAHSESVREADTQEKILISEINNINMEIEKQTIKAGKLTEDINPDIETELVKVNEDISSIKDEFNKFNLGNIDNITQDEIKQAVETVTDIINKIDAIYDNVGVPNLGEFINEYGHISETIDQLNKDIDKIKLDNEWLTSEKIRLEMDHKITSELNNRPSNCKIDNCYFISKSLDTLKQYGTIEELERKLQEVTNTKDENDRNLSFMTKKVSFLRNMLSSEALLGAITSMVKSSRAILGKMRIFVLLSDESALKAHISNGYAFNEYRNISELLYISNDLTRYKSLVEVQRNLQSEYKINKDKINSYKELQLEIEANKDKVTKLTEDMKKVTATKNFNISLVSDINSKIINLNGLRESYINNQKNIENLNNYIKELEDIKNKFSSSEQYLLQISEDKSKIQEYLNELNPITNELKAIDTQLTLLDEYHREYQELNEKYTIIDKLKKYSSPVSGGIQTLFMNLYMSKTLELANQLLAMIFGGQFQLADYVINQDEFRIPFTGRGLMVDDISSGSTSQICIMGMIINLVLLHQASSKFNITRLDEIDGGLDHQNRYMFVDILQKIVNILQIDQLFIISHSVESALSNVDVIQLAPMPDEETFTGANIIYTYKDRR